MKQIIVNTRIEFAQLDEATGKTVPGLNGWTIPTHHHPGFGSWDITWRGRTRHFSEGEIFQGQKIEHLAAAELAWVAAVDATIEHEKLKESDPKLWAACEAAAPGQLDCAEARA